MQEQVTRDDFRNLWESDATFDHLVWRGDRLVPAAPADVASISDDLTGAQQDGRPHRASRRSLCWRGQDLRDVRVARRRGNTAYVPHMGCPPLVFSWLLAMGAHRRSIYKEGAHAKRSVTR